MHPKWTPGAAWLIGLFGLLAEGPAHAGPPDHRDKNGVEVLTRGPVHEAYALPADQQTAPGPLVPRQPPADVEELPPDQKPDGADVQWLPGYWSWDDERRDFVWVSGFWRVPPPDRAWVPGGWRKGGSGWQWVSGFWNPVGDPARPEARIEFLPEPPAPIEAGPTIPAPANDSVYVPGTWVYRERYLWRSGYWADYRPGWVWAPACYRWTPSGHVFIDGYWDRSLEDRGVLFPPVAIAQEVYAAPGFAYTPAYAIRPDSLYEALFVCRDRGSYYFGDYFGHDYAGAGFTPWCSGYVNVGFGAPRGFCDPLFSYYRAAHLSDSYWGGGGIGRLYADRYRGEGARPPRTLVQQNLVVNNLTNNTVINNTVINNATVVTPLRADRRMGDRTWAAVTPESRRQYAGDARQSREVGRQRQQLETQLAARGPQPSQATAGTRSGTISLPSRVVARGQAPAAQSKPDVPAGRPQATAIRSVDQRSPTQPAQPRVAAAPPAPRPTVAGRAAPSRVDPNSQAPRALSRPEANPSRINPRSSVVDQPKENRLSPSAPPRSPRPEFG